MQKFWQNIFCRITGTVRKLRLYRCEALALAAVALLLCFWVFQKEGYHMDEQLSFELANARYNPWIVPTQPEGRLAKFMREEIDGENIGETFQNVVRVVQDTLVNRGEGILAGFKADVYEEPVWIGRQQFRDYITVDGGDAFNYLSVYFNVKDDNHPPLHFMLLHTVSSVFQGKVSPWLGCVINIAAVLGCCILLMLTGKELWGNKWYGIAAALLYGLSGGAAATVLLIRMYGVMTFFCVWILYLHLKKWKSGEYRKQNRLLITVTVLGFLTQYFFLFYMIGIALVTVALLAARKKGREIFFYIRSMCIAAVIGLGLFPFAVSDVFSSERGVEALGNLSGGLDGYGERLAAFGNIFAGRFPGGIAGASLVLLILAAGIVIYLRNRPKRQTEKIYSGEAYYLWIPILLYFLLASKMSPYLVDRYIMPLFPLAILAIVYLAWRVRLSAVLLTGAALLLGAVSVFTYDGEYLFKGYRQQQEIAENNRLLPCICVYEGYGFYKNLTEFSEYEQTLLVTMAELETRSRDAVIDGADEVLVLVKSEIDQKKLKELLLEKYGYRVDKVLLEDGVHHDSIWLCKR